jgi:hypothetical protein
MANAVETETGKSLTEHWRVKEIEFDEQGRVVIGNPKLAAILKEQIAKGKHIYVSAANSGNYCVVVSSPCNAVEEL